MWITKMHTTINHCLKNNESMTETCSDVPMKAFYRLESIFNAENYEKEKERNQSSISSRKRRI